MSDFERQVRAALDEIRPALRADGGDIELVRVDEGGGRVEVRLRGACASCPASSYTLAYGVDVALRRRLPGLREVAAI